MIKVDLNCDMGESFGLYGFGNDEEMMKYITSANIACGFHAGDPHVMRKTVQKAKEYDVAIGAHPGFPDLLGFGRRKIMCTDEEIKDFIIYQIGALREFAKLYDIHIQHCKPHGALYSQAMEDKKIARAFLEAISHIDPNIIVYAENNSEVLEQANQFGIPVIKEVFSDREHAEDGSFVLTREGPMIGDYKKLADRVVRMVIDEKVETIDGKDITIQAETICIHGDTAGAPKLAKAIVKALEEKNVQLTSAQNVLK